MADEAKMVSVKIDDDIDPENFDYEEKGDVEKNVSLSGNLGTMDDEDSEDAQEDNDTDTAELLAGKKKTPPFWTFEYYQTFFDVETTQVLRRILASMVPARKTNFVATQIRSNPDLYGPFWVCVTLVVTIAISGNLANYLVHTRERTWKYDFHKITFAAVAIFGYAWLVPVGVWSVLTWRGNMAGYSFLEIICVYGYSLSIFIPISILWLIPFEITRWIFVIIGLCLSGAVLILTFWPAVKSDDRKIGWAILFVIFLLHGGLSIGFKMYFFHPPLIDEDAKTTRTPITTTSSPSLIAIERKQPAATTPSKDRNKREGK